MSQLPKTVRCPRCQTPSAWEGNPHRPFCSEKCRQVDLGRWASEDYRIAGRRADPEAPENILEFPDKNH